MGKILIGTLRGEMIIFKRWLEVLGPVKLNFKDGTQILEN